MATNDVSERIFQDQVLQIARMNGWLIHHAAPHKTGGAWRSDGKGTPDLILCHPTKGVIFAELKTERGKMTEDQKKWARAVTPWCEWYLWRPSQLQLIAQRLGQVPNA